MSIGGLPQLSQVIDVSWAKSTIVTKTAIPVQKPRTSVGDHPQLLQVIEASWAKPLNREVAKYHLGLPDEDHDVQSTVDRDPVGTSRNVCLKEER